MSERTPDHHERGRVLDAAARILGDEGPEALSVRRVAEAVGVSRQIVYTRFGGKPGLVDALYREGFRRLSDHCGGLALVAGDPESVVRAACGYREFALANQPFYRVMFGRPVPGYTPPVSSRGEALAAYGHLIRAIRACFEAGTLRASSDNPSAASLAHKVWALTHGLVSIELERFFEPPRGGEERLAAGVRALLGPCRIQESAQVDPARERSYAWSDPARIVSAMPGQDGLHVLRAIRDGRLPSPPICATLGLTIAGVEEGRVEFLFRAREYQCNPLGTVHGGVLATICDSAAGCAVHSKLPKGRSYTTLDLNVKFLRPVLPDGRSYRCEGTVTHFGRRTALAEASLLDPKGKVCARAWTTCLLFSVEDNPVKASATDQAVAKSAEQQETPKETTESAPSQEETSHGET